MAFVHLTVADNELEADLLCGMLRANGISCTHQISNVGPEHHRTELKEALKGKGAKTEVLVEESQLAQAQRLLPG
jgi:hypothetical protein